MNKMMKGSRSTDADDLQRKMHQLKVSYLMQCWDLHTAFTGETLCDDVRTEIRKGLEHYVEEFPDGSFNDFSICIGLYMVKEGLMSNKQFIDILDGEDG